MKLSESGNDQAETYALLANTHATLAVVDALSEIRDRMPPASARLRRAVRTIAKIFAGPGLVVAGVTTS